MTNRYVVIPIIILGSYLMGAINPSYLMARARGFDIRQKGSGNAGASNALITMGKRTGIFCILLDILKSFLVTRLVMWLYPPDALGFLACLAGVFCIIGHIFPFYMGFHGGKGLACLAGFVLAYHPFVFLFMLLGEVLLAFMLDYICVVPITASVIFPVVCWFMDGRFSDVLVMSLGAVIILLKHIENIQRIRAGKEMRISYLWKGDAELERISGEKGKEPM